MAVSPLVGAIWDSFSKTLSLSGLRYAAVVAPVPKITIPTLSLGSNDPTRIFAEFFAASTLRFIVCSLHTSRDINHKYYVYTFFTLFKWNMWVSKSHNHRSDRCQRNKK